MEYNRNGDTSTRLDEVAIVATISSFASGAQQRYLARILIPGRPILVPQPSPSERAAIMKLRSRWPEVRIVDQQTFARYEGQRLVAPVVEPKENVAREAGDGQT